MKANELRLGNYLTHNNGSMIGVFRVDLIHLSDIIQNNDYGKQYEPVPLTEEWLVKFGFKKKGDELVLILDLNNSIIYDGSVKIRLSNPFEFGSIEYNTKIQYVHQLQNLYFALAGEELTWKQ